MLTIWRNSLLLSSLCLALLAQHSVSGQTLRAESKPSTGLQLERVNPRQLPADPGSAIRQLESELLSSPGDAVLLNNLGVLYALSGRNDEAVRSLETAAMHLDKVYQVQANFAIVLRNVGRMPEAIERAKYAVRLRPERQQTRLLLCELFVQATSAEEAVNCFERLDKAFELDTIATANYGAALVAMGRTKDAAEMLEPFAVAHPDAPGIHNALGLAYYREKKYRDALREFEQGMKSSPERPEIRYNLAIANLAIKDRGAALEHYKFLQIKAPQLAARVSAVLFRDKVVNVNN